MAHLTTIKKALSLEHLDVICWEHNREEKTLTIILKGGGYSVDFRQFGEWQEQEMVYTDVFPFMEEYDDVEDYFKSFDQPVRVHDYKSYTTLTLQLPPNHCGGSEYTWEQIREMVVDTEYDDHPGSGFSYYNFDEDDDEQPEGLVALIKEGEEDDEWNTDGDYEEYGIRKIYFWAYTPKGLDFGDEFIHDDEWVEGADDSFVRTNYWLWYDENHDLTDDQTQLMARANLPEGYDWDWGFDD